MKGKVGKGRHGGFAERSLLTCHMRSVKLSKRVEQFSKDVSDILSESQFVLNSEVIKLRVARAPQAMGLALQLTQVSTKGRMQITVSAAFMNHQANFLAKLAQWCLAEPPLLVIKHFKWDETQLQCTMNADKSGCRVRSSWQVLVCRMRLVVVWPNGTNVVCRVVMPPVTLLATGAEHQYYALLHHPAYKCINALVGLLRRTALVNIDIAETDGASSNLRLLAHLSQKAKLSVFGPPGSRHPVLFAHCRCMNHAVQLNNAALLGLIGSNSLNRIYGLTVFIRNLGYWLRMRQAVRSWLDRNLVFRQQVTASDVASHVQPNPALRELISYLRFWKKLDKDCRSPEDERRETAQDDGESAFDRAAATFLDMFNGPIVGPPCHICSSLDVSVGQRHCSHRESAVRKCAEAMIDLFLTSMPAVSKLADMVGKWLVVQEKGSENLQALPAVRERMEMVRSKVMELYSVLQEVMQLKYKHSFEKMAADVAKLVKGGTQEEMTGLTSSISTSFAQLSAFQPFSKVGLVKILGKTLAEASRELDGIVQTVAKCATSLQAAFPQVADFIAKKNTNEEVLADQPLADVFAIFFDAGSKKVIGRTVPFLEVSFSLLQEGMTRSICGWLAQTSATYAAFLEQLLQPEVNADASFSVDVLGDTTSLSETAAGETQDCKQTLNFGFVFHSYVKHIGKELVDIAVHGAQEGKSRRVHAVFPCLAGALLTVAKMAVVDFEAMLSASREIVGELDGIDAYYKQLQKIMKDHVADVISNFGREIGDVQLSLASLYQQVASKHSLDMFGQEVLDKKAVEALCLDPSMRQIAMTSSKTERFFIDLIGLLQDVQGLPTPSWVGEASKALVSGVVTDAKKLLAQDVECHAARR
ncbi:unnamed protein product, partial [Symbiodinium sp. CCMP2592]